MQTRQQRRKAERDSYKKNSKATEEGFKKVASDVMGNGYFIKSKDPKKGKYLYAHPHGNGYKLRPKTRGAAVFGFEEARNNCESGYFKQECEPIKLSDALK